MKTYFILNKELNRVKIGKSLTPERRLTELDVNLTPLELVATFPCSGETEERVLHKRFRAYRIRGEWFKWSKSIRNFILNKAEVVVPTYQGTKLKWTPVCCDCLRPIWPDSLQCPSCRALKNRGGIRKPPKVRQPPPPKIDMSRAQYNPMYDSAVVPWKRFQLGLPTEVLGSWMELRPVTVEDFCPDCHGWKSLAAKRCSVCAGKNRSPKR